MRRNKVEFEIWRRGGKVLSDRLFINRDGAEKCMMMVSDFRCLFGFTPRPGKQIKITMEIQEESK